MASKIPQLAQSKAELKSKTCLNLKQGLAHAMTIHVRTVRTLSHYLSRVEYWQKIIHMAHKEHTYH